MGLIDRWPIRRSRRASLSAASRKIIRHRRQYRSMAVPNLRRNALLWNMAQPSAFRYGLIVAESWPALVSLVGPTRGSSAFGLTHGFAIVRLKYIGFNGRGGQVRDCLDPRDLLSLLRRQMDAETAQHRIFNVGGGPANSMSLAQLSVWCADRFGPGEVAADPNQRPFDIPWMVLDSKRAIEEWNWQVETPIETVLGEIADHAESHPEWLELSAS